MKEAEELKWNELLKDNRIDEQKRKADYSYHESGEIEKCDDCGSYIFRK